MTEARREGHHLIFPETAERIKRWREDPAVLGVLLVGSKSHEHNDELSDDDLEVILTGAAYKKLKPADCIEVLAHGDGANRRLLHDAQFIGLPEMEAKAMSPFDLDHWPYERARILYDSSGGLLQLVGSFGSMDLDFRRLRLTHATIDAWIAIYRTQKTARRHYEAAARVLLVLAARALARIAFALEGRWVPLDHWLQGELLTLEDKSEVVPLLIRALIDTDIALLQRALESFEAVLAREVVPGPQGRRDLFLELIHPSRAAERAIHGLV